MLVRLEISMQTIKLVMSNCIAPQSMLNFYCTVLWLWGRVEMLISAHIIIHGYTEGRRCKWRIDWPSEKNLYSLVSFNVCNYKNFPCLSFCSEKKKYSWNWPANTSLLLNHCQNSKDSMWPLPLCMISCFAWFLLSGLKLLQAKQNNRVGVFHTCKMNIAFIILLVSWGLFKIHVVINIVFHCCFIFITWSLLHEQHKSCTTSSHVFSYIYFM